MPDPIGFSATTARFKLPFLNVAQAQKEVFVNEAHVILDALLHPVVQGATDTPPTDPKSGECWIVAPSGNGLFASHDDEIACYHDGQWIFCSPAQGMQVFDLTTGALAFFANGWSRLSPISSPQGGTNVDIEARAAIEGIIDALNQAGITG